MAAKVASDAGWAVARDGSEAVLHLSVISGSLALAAALWLPRAEAGGTTRLTLPDGNRALVCATGTLVGPAIPALGDGRPVAIMARPEAISLEPDTGAALAPGQMRGTIAARYFHGAFADYRVTVGTQDVSVQAIPSSPFKAGDAVLLRPDPARLWAIPAAAQA